MLNPIEYNHKKAAEKELVPLLDEIEEVCIKHHIPFFFSACVACKKKDEETYAPEYLRRARTAASFGFFIPKQDEIEDCYSLSCGAKAIISQQGIDLDSLLQEDSMDF